MATTAAPPVHRLAPVLAVASEHGFAVGSFAPRYTAMIRPILRAGQKLASPLIVQISQREMQRYGITPGEFGEAFRTRWRSRNNGARSSPSRSNVRGSRCRRGPHRTRLTVHDR